jgi:hypothetical protein
MREIKEMFYSFQQGKHTSLQCYHKVFLGQVEVIEQVGMTIADESLVESIVALNGRAGAPEEADWTAACEQALAIHFVCGANAMHKAYLTHLRNSFLDGSNYYPKTLHEAYNILHQCHEPEGGPMTIDEDDGLAFLNAGGEPQEGMGHNLD